MKVDLWVGLLEESAMLGQTQIDGMEMSYLTFYYDRGWQNAQRSVYTLWKEWYRADLLSWDLLSWTVW